MNLNDIIGKLTGEVEHMLDFLEWEERRFLEEHSKLSLPRLFDVIKTIDTSDYEGYARASQIFEVTKDVCFRAENFQIAVDKLEFLGQFLQLYPDATCESLSSHVQWFGSIVNSIFKILEYCPSHGNLIPIMEFINSNHFHNLSERINNSILSAIHKIVRLSNNPRSYEEELAIETLPQETSNQIIQVISTTYLQQPIFTKTGLEIIVDLNTRDVIEIVARFLRSDDDLCQIALYYLRDFWDEIYLDRVAEIARRGDASWTTLAALRVLGDYGDERHIEALLEDLQRYSSLSGKGYKLARDAVENGLVNLREHSHEDLVFLAVDDHISPGHKRAVKRVLKMINEAQDLRGRVNHNWRKELCRWRTQKAAKENEEYVFKILTDNHILKIYNRQPLTYIDLLSIDGIGPNKINQYGYEILNIVNENQLDEYKIEIPERWNLCDDVEGFLLSSCLKLFHSNEVNTSTNSQLAEFLKSRDCHTKGQLKKLLHEEFDSTEKEIINSLLEYLFNKMRYSETKFVLLEGGKGRGKRFALTKE